MSIIQNKKAYHDYFVEDKYEAGIVLGGGKSKQSEIIESILKRHTLLFTRVRSIFWDVILRL